MQRGMLCTFVLLVACTSARAPAGKTQPTCGPVVEGAIDRMMADAKGSMPPEALARVEAIAPRMKGAIVDTCTTTKWSTDVLSCMTAAKSQADINACADKLTPEQKSSYEAATAAAFMAGARKP